MRGQSPHNLFGRRRKTTPQSQVGARLLTSRSEVFLAQAETSAAGRSPLYEALWRRLAEEPLIDEIVEEYRWDTPLRLAGGLHYLVLEGRASWQGVSEALAEHRDFLRWFVAEQSVQTNEVQRSWMLLPCFLEVARRTRAEQFDVIELGPSAGLNLIWDRYRYRYEAGVWGPPVTRLELRGEERHPVPGELLLLAPRVRSRIGVDIAPIDVTTEEGARLLKAFVWADQRWRLELLDQAIAVLREDPPELVRGDVAELLPGLLEGRTERALTLVFQTALFGYVGVERAAEVHAILDRAGAEAPLAYVGTHAPAPDVHTHYGLVVRVWPAERETVAHADFHGAWLEWLGR